MSYNFLNTLHRALDVYNFPLNISLIKQIQCVRLLYQNLRHRDTYKYLPSIDELQTRFNNLAFEIYADPKETQAFHELIDTSLELGIPLPTATRSEIVVEQSNLLRQYAQLKPKKSADVYALKSITMDKQNVHHHGINEQIKIIVRKIVDDYPCVLNNHIWKTLEGELRKHIHSWRDTNIQSLKFIKENISTFNLDIGLKELLGSLFLWIMHQKDDSTRSQLFNRLNEELHDMRGTCSTGHLSRLINVVQGFSERYEIKIEPEKEMKAYIYQHLTNALKRAPESVQEGMIEKTSPYINFLTDPKWIEHFSSRFGKKNIPFIQKCTEEFAGTSLY